MTVKDQPIYNGLYFIGSAEDWTSLTDNSNFQFVVVGFGDGGHFVDIRWDGVQYIGTRICDPNIPQVNYRGEGSCELGATEVITTQWGKISFTIEQDVVSNFTWDWPSQPCWLTGLCTSHIGIGSSCPLLIEGGGTVEDDLAIKVNLVGEDCIMEATISLSLLRQ